MSTQGLRIRNMSNPNQLRNQTAILNQRLQGLPDILAAKHQRESIERQNKFNTASLANQNRQLALQAKSQAFEQKKFKKLRKAQKRSDEIGMGVSALGLAGRLGMGGRTTVGGALNKAGGIFGKSPGMSTTSGVGGLSLSGMGSGGAAGFGLASLIGGNMKSKIGAGILGAGLGGLFL